jgi:serine/alanine adding enzyme
VSTEMECKDIYFVDEYCKVYEKNNDGQFQSFQMECKYGRICYNFLLREIQLLPEKNFYDITTPYGYGGPLILYYEKGYIRELELEFKKRFEEFCSERRIVTEFIRFHPLIGNHEYMELYMDVIYNRDTVYMDLSSREKLWENMYSTCRNRIRKAQNNNVVVQIDNSRESIDHFITLYYQTMVRNIADKYYFFSRQYFYNLFDLLKGSAYIFNAIYANETIASMIVLKYGDYVNCHLSGADYRYIDLAPVNLLIYEAALWGHEQGCKYFHLGGGYRGNKDSLFAFKRKFSKQGTARFYIGRKIHNEHAYKSLVERWNVLNEKEKNGKIDFFPIYRRP